MNPQMKTTFLTIKTNICLVLAVGLYYKHKLLTPKIFLTEYNKLKIPFTKTVLWPLSGHTKLSARAKGI